MASSKLLKEAIADAKAVRETALANAKLQLEEAFTPRLKSMLSQKLRAEAEDAMKADDEVSEAWDDKEEGGEKVDEEYSSSNIGSGDGGTNSGQTNKKPTEHDAASEEEHGAAGVKSTSGKPEAEVEDYEFAKSITEANGEEEDLASGNVKFATEADEFGGDDQQHDEVNGQDDDQQSEDDLDLEAIIKELEDELHGGGDDESGYDAMGHDDSEHIENEAADEVDVAMHADKPDAVIAQLPDTMAKFELNTPLRLAHFLAQAGHESGGFKAVQENLNYGAKGLRSIFGKYFPDDSTALLYERKPEKIANIVYASRMGNGDKSSGDGWKFRGRGYIQLTGKSNYTAFDAIVPENLLEQPDLVATKYPLLSAAWFFHKNGLNTIADKGADDATVTSVTKRVNGGTIGLPDRIKHFKEYYSLLA